MQLWDCREECQTQESDIQQFAVYVILFQREDRGRVLFGPREPFSIALCRVQAESSPGEARLHDGFTCAACGCFRVLDQPDREGHESTTGRYHREAGPGAARVPELADVPRGVKARLGCVAVAVSPSTPS